ncbi:hypothetical protein Q31b_21050 [Novipirellula aureliae]|uniref:Uncharacterized protein n=2 Tax=Novipirellula aureliae TaxID=2527966 RepID=A0A5C6E2I1_9BACT|nr:hypothetical protein Q31b_21050 [Novipirellula aureliae]
MPQKRPLRETHPALFGPGPQPWFRPSSSPEKFIFFRCFFVLLLSVGFHVKLSAQVSPPETTLDSAPIFAKLSQRSVNVFDGNPFGEALDELAEQANVAIWIDRKIDHSATISAGQVGPTVYLSMQQIAEIRDCVIMPVRDILLVGRPEWVEETAVSLARLPNDSLDPINVSWSNATTPSEIVESILDEAKLRAEAIDLPHDLWAANEWASVDPAVALTLVLAQFDLRLVAATFPKRMKVESATARERYAVKYEVTPERTKFLAAVRQRDRASQVQTQGQTMVVSASAAAHRAGTNQFFIEQSKMASSPTDLDTENLALNLLNTPANQVFEKLAGAAERTCVIQDSAEEACKTLVSFEAKKSSFRKLVAEVARLAEVTAEWTDQSLIISGR